MTRAWQIGLFDAGQRILKGQEHERRWGLADIPNRCVELLLIITGCLRQFAGLSECLLQRAFCCAALLPILPGLFSIALAYLFTPFDISTVQPAEHARQIMGGRGCQGGAGPVLG